MGPRGPAGLPFFLLSVSFTVRTVPCTPHGIISRLNSLRIFAGWKINPNEDDLTGKRPFENYFILLQEKNKQIKHDEPVLRRIARKKFPNQTYFSDWNLCKNRLRFFFRFFPFFFSLFCLSKKFFRNIFLPSWLFYKKVIQQTIIDRRCLVVSTRTELRWVWQVIHISNIAFPNFNFILFLFSFDSLSINSGFGKRGEQTWLLPKPKAESRNRCKQFGGEASYVELCFDDVRKIYVKFGVRARALLGDLVNPWNWFVGLSITIISITSHQITFNY